MSHKEVQAKLQEVFDSVFTQPVKLHPGLSAKDVLEWNSLSHIVLVVSIENAFSIRFKLGEVAALKNVGELIELIGKRIQKIGS